MGVVLVALAALAVLCAGALVALFVLSPSTIVRDEMIRQVKQRTGRELVIAGPTSLSVWGVVAASMGDISLSAPAGMGGAPLLRARRLSAEVALWPLLRGELIVDRLVLSEPVVDLRVDANGRHSWDFAEATARGAVRYAQAGNRGNAQSVPPELAEFLANSSKDGKAAPAPALAPAGRLRMGELAIGEVRIVRGTLRYSDARSGQSETLTEIDLGLAGRALGQPMTAKGDSVWRGERVALDARLASPAAVIEGRAAKLVLALGSARGRVHYDGSVNVSAAGPVAEGAITVEAPSARALASWLGATLPPARGFGPLTLAGELRAASNSVQLTRSAIRLDETKTEGSIGVEIGGRRPLVRADLVVTGLDLETYQPDGTAADTSPPPAASKTTGGTARTLSIEDLLRRDGADVSSGGARVKGYTRRAGWSEDAISAAALGAVDAEARVSLGQFRAHGLAIDSSVVRLGLRDAVLTATFDDVRLYGGRGRGVLTLDGSAPAAPRIGLNVSADGVSAQPLLKDAADFDWLEGPARIQLALGGQGGSERAIVESLNGRVDYALGEGAIVGIDVTKTMRGLTAGRFQGLERRMSERTPFSELAASFRITAGVAETKDLRLIGPDLRATGNGTVDLGKRQLGLSLRPRIATQGAKSESGFEIPLRLTGSWDDPRLAPDLDAVLKDPGKAADAVRDLVRQPGVSDGVKGILDAVQGGDSRGARERAKGLLDQFLKR